MICLSVGSRGVDFKAINADLVEVRADLCGYSASEISGVLEGVSCAIVTCRVAEVGEQRAREILTQAVLSGAKYIDVECEVSDDYLSYFQELTARYGVKLIVSYHNFVATHSLSFLQQIYKNFLAKGADIVKIATTAATFEEATQLIELYGTAERGRLVAFSMGAVGRFTRELSLSCGAPFTYVSYDASSETASGQYTYREMRKLLDEKRYAYRFDGAAQNLSKVSLQIPSSKSVAQRAIIAGTLAKGTSTFSNFAPCDDICAAIEVARSLGARVEISGTQLIIEGVDGRIAASELSVGESGLLARIMLPLSLLIDGAVTISGTGSLLQRSVSETTDALQRAGARCDSSDGYLPVVVSGSIESKEISFSGSLSSQVVTGFLMSLPLLSHSTTLRIDNPVSLPYIFLTISILGQFGIEIKILEHSPKSLVFYIEGSQKYKSTDLHLDGDWSSAAPFAVAAAISSPLTLRGLPLKSMQADEAILSVLKSVGARVITTPQGIEIKPADSMQSFDFDATNCPDLFPILTLLATQCSGESSITGLSRLYQKESNRAESIYLEFTKLGANLRVVGDTLYIRGGALHGARVRGHNDHRIVMALVVASLVTDGAVCLDELRSLDKSFPKFLTYFSYESLR